MDLDLGFNGEDVFKYLQGRADAVNSGYYSPFCHHGLVLIEIQESYRLTADQVVVELPRGDDTRCVNTGRYQKSLAKAKDEGMRLLDTRKNNAEKLGHRSYMVSKYDEGGKCSKWYHFDADTSKGCKNAIEHIQKQLQSASAGTEQHPLAIQRLNSDLEFLKFRAEQIDATDDVAGAKTDAAKVNRTRKRKASSRQVFILSEDWNNHHAPMQLSGIRVAKIIDGLLTKARPLCDPSSLWIIYDGWGDDEILTLMTDAENTGNSDHVRVVPGLPGQPGYEPSQHPPASQTMVPVKSETIDCSSEE